LEDGIKMIAIASDHAGYELKMEIVRHLKEKGVEFEDLGTCDGITSVDYNDFGVLVAEAVARGTHDRGIIVCGTGIGISISANKVPGIRAALCTDSYMARMSREHNDANVLALGGRVVGAGVAVDIVDTWLGASFLGGRHQRRVDKFAGIEQKYTAK
jgi:ribose 5-phosphate isomerase B